MPDRVYPDYEPYDHRHVLHPTTFIETTLHMIKSSLGSGVLAMPHAFYRAGYIVGVIGTVMLGLFSAYCMRTLVILQYELCRRYELPSMTYSATAEYSMKEGPQCSKTFNYAGLVSNIMLLGFQIGASCIYIIFIAHNTKQLLEHHIDTDLDSHVYATCCAVLLVLAIIIKDLKVLTILSFLGNITTIIGIFIICIYIFNEVPNFDKCVPVGKIEHFPLFIGTTVFSMEAIGAVMVLENEMKDPKKFISMCGVLTWALGPTILLYVMLGLLGYLKYGEEIQDVITLNLPQEEILAQLCIYCLVIGIFCTNVLAIFIAYEILWHSYIDKIIDSENETFKLWLMQFGVRTLLAVIAFIIAILVPRLELVISLVGSLILATTGISFVGIMGLYVYWEDYTGHRFILHLIKYMTVIIIGVVILIIGLYVTILDASKPPKE